MDAPKRLRLLFVEDSEDDAVFVLRELRRGGYEPVFERVDTSEEFAGALKKQEWDFIIADYSMPMFSATAALELLQESGIDLPFIIVSGAIGEDVAVAAMKSGAHDYILKGNLARLVPAVERELRDAQVRRNRKLTEEELRTSREELRALAAHLQSIREEERKLIAREIHDELGQSLTGFKMDLAWIRNRLQARDETLAREPILEKINVMGQLLDGTANLVRKLCTELRPGILDDLGLLAAIEWQTREYSKRTGLQCDVEIEVKNLEIDSERSTAIFRIFQEILTNVARHARAKQVEIRMREQGDQIILEVSDDGRGIQPGEAAGKKSLGLLGMRERALLFGGEVSIHGQRGKGTRVEVKVPLHPSANGTSNAKDEARPERDLNRSKLTTDHQSTPGDPHA